MDWEDEQEKEAWKRKDLEGERSKRYKTEQRRANKSNKDRVMERNTGEDREEKRLEERMKCEKSRGRTNREENLKEGQTPKGKRRKWEGGREFVSECHSLNRGSD